MIRLLKYNVIALVLLGLAAPIAADTWNERTTITFSEPVLIPGATLSPGTYVFELGDSTTMRQMVRIRQEDPRRVIATTLAVPMKRREAAGDTVLVFAATDKGTPPAVKGWYFPGSLYGHEFVYPDQQAKRIAQRTKTLVLSTDMPGSSLEKGTIHVYDAAGVRAEWRGDSDLIAEWEGFERTRHERAEANASIVDAKFKGRRVRLDELESNPRAYLSERVSVDAEVQDIFGPRLFTVDEPNWMDTDRELIVFAPTALAALVREDDRVTITGRIVERPNDKVKDLREGWGWHRYQAAGADRADRPMLIAERIVGGDDQRAMLIEAQPPHAATAGPGAHQDGPIASPGVIAMADEESVGRKVTLSGVQVADRAEDGGFFVKAGDRSVFVLPAKVGESSAQASHRATFAEGATVSISGVLLAAPGDISARSDAPANAVDDIYVLATEMTTTT